MPRSKTPNQTHPRFKTGDQVMVQLRFPKGHIRTPYYLRGKRGIIIKNHGEFLDAEKLANGLNGLPGTPVYQVAFDFREVWGKADVSESHTVILADLQENWLDPGHRSE